MKPETASHTLLSVTRSKAKMYEYGVPRSQHIRITQDPAQLLRLAIGMLGDYAAECNRQTLESSDLVEMRGGLTFSSYFFDAFFQSRLSEDHERYLQLLSAAAYYLGELPGSSGVMARGLHLDTDLEGGGLERLLISLLKNASLPNFDEDPSPLGILLDRTKNRIADFYHGTVKEAELRVQTAELRRFVYSNGTPRQLLLADVLTSIILKKLENSSRHSLPRYTGLSVELWQAALDKSTFVKELWPSQHLLGKAEVLSGRSAVCQMPTSAGKTKAAELVIRSAFLADRTSMAVIVAPFKALCTEIRNSLAVAFKGEDITVADISDVYQHDVDLSLFTGQRHVLVMTPEKLVYSLRHDETPAGSFGLVILDEGHQFDTGERGITYELLITTLKALIPHDSQKLLISAVIQNARNVGDWLNGLNSSVISGENLSPTFRSIGFASWTDSRGRIEYVSNIDSSKQEYFVPYVIESSPLEKRGKEYKDRVFPTKGKGQEVALFLGLKLVNQGSVAIFCGSKLTANKLCGDALFALERGAPLRPPSRYSDPEEIQRLQYLTEANLGPASRAHQAAGVGIFCHCGTTHEGLRLAIEHAMREDLIKFVVCTSTLAQGVNLPIRYLIVTSVYQAGEKIKVRDFHNLMGRVGRAGMHTEGSVLFADPMVYDQKSWRWDLVQHMLNPRNSEPSVSTLLSLFDSPKSDDGIAAEGFDALDFIRRYVDDTLELDKIATKIASDNPHLEFKKTDLPKQLEQKLKLLTSVEGFLLANWAYGNDRDVALAETAKLAESTLAYFLTNDERKRAEILHLFQVLTENILAKVENDTRRRIYSRTFLSVSEARQVESWVNENRELLFQARNSSDFCKALWPLYEMFVKDKTFAQCSDREALQEVCLAWTEGKMFHELLALFTRSKCYLKREKTKGRINVEVVVELCQGSFAYHAALLTGAVVEFLGYGEIQAPEPMVRLQAFQKQLSYGLPSSAAIALYEMGLSDRAVAFDLAASLGLTGSSIDSVKIELQQMRNTADAYMEKYPDYFRCRLREILT
jgi:POLQ-like helicase